MKLPPALKTPWAAFALVAVIVAGTLVLALRGDALTATAKVLIIGQMFGWVPALLSLMKSEAIQHDIRNGVMKEGVKDAITEMAEDPDVESVAMIVTPDYNGPDRRH